MSLSFYSQDGVYRGYYKEAPITKNNLTSHLANCTYLGSQMYLLRLNKIK